MAHARTQIRNALKALLAGLSSTGSNVFDSRGLVMQDSELPGLIVLTNEERVETQDAQNNVQERVITVSVIAKAKSNAALDDVIDNIVRDVEVRVQTDRYLGGLLKAPLSLSSITVDIADDQETDVGQAVMQFESVYYTQAGAPESII